MAANIDRFNESRLVSYFGEFRQLFVVGMCVVCMVDRRRFLQVSAASLPVVLAGCTGGGSNNDGGGVTPTNSSGGGKDTEPTTPTPTSAQSKSQTSDETATPTATPTSGKATVTKSQFKKVEGEYTTDVFVTGLVKNTGKGPLKKIEVTGKFYDESGGLVSHGTAQMIGMPPGEVWEPYILALEDPSKVSDGKMVVSGVKQGGVPEAEGVKVLEHTLETGEEILVHGRLKNTSGTTIDYIEPNVKLYAENGHVLKRAYTNKLNFKAGNVWRFELSPLMPKPRATRVTKHALAVLTSNY